MRVAFVSVGDPNDPDYWSGIPFGILHELVKIGVKIDVLAPLAGRFRYLYVGHKVIWWTLGREFDINRQPFALRKYRDQIMRRLKDSEAEVVFAPSSIPVAMLDCRQPIIYWSDAVWAVMVSYYDSFSRLAATTVRNGQRQEQLAMDRATFAVYASQWAADSARRYYNIENAKVKVIPFGANLEISHSLDAVVQMIKARPRDRCRLLFIGVEWKRKGGALAVETARLLNEAGLPTTLRVVGCDPFRRSETPPFVERLGFISKRTDLGRAKLQDLLSTSHFLILPSRAEAAGIVFCEASAFGLPSITTDTGGIPTYIRNGMNGICLSLEATADEYAREIYKLFVDRDRYEHMGIDSFCEYETRLNWRTAVTSLSHLMKECTA